MDLRSGELHRRRRKRELQEQPFRILALLLEHPGDVVTREELRARLWPDGTLVDFDHGINTAVLKLRHTLGDTAAHPRFIETLGRRGYRFIGRIGGESIRAVPKGAAPAAGRTPSGRSDGLTPFVGREPERRLLLERFEQARRGEDQLVLITGEPGIGKSRLALQLRAELEEARHTWIECRGSPHHQHTPFHPMFALLQQASVLPGKEPVGDRSAGLEVALGRAGLELSEAVPLVRMVLGLPRTERYPALLVPPEAARRRLVTLLRAWIVGMARRQPLVLVFEDLHWMDVSTLGVLERLVLETLAAPVLMLFTARPEFRVPWPLLGHHAQLVLPRLARRQVREVAASVAGGAALPEGALELVFARTDGVPIFIEEFTKTVVFAGGFDTHEP